MVFGDFTILRDLASMREFSLGLKKQGRVLALVPTMGALHKGHLSLLQLAAENADDVIVSIYVNPKQFGLNEDFDKYPRDLESDLEVLRNCGVRISAVYAPKNMYGDDFSTNFNVALGEHLCGAFRPNYFGGVAMVVAKLFHHTCADKAVFGEKDYQQLVVIRRMVADLDFAVEVLAAETLRDGDGLALSSRNVYLTDAERQIAPSLHKVLCDCKGAILAGGNVVEVLRGGEEQLLAGGFRAVDYLHLVRADDLEIIDGIIGAVDYRLVCACYLGKARLIDNIGFACSA